MLPLVLDPEETLSLGRVPVGSISVASGVTNSGQPAGSDNTVWPTNATSLAVQPVSIPLALAHRYLASYRRSLRFPIGPLSKNLGRTAPCQDESNCPIKTTLTAKEADSDVSSESDA